MRWLVLYRREDADPEAYPSPHLILVVSDLLLLRVLSSTVRGVLHLLLPPQAVLLLKKWDVKKSVISY
jgi:hypothetical protein